MFSVPVTGPPARGQHVKKVAASMCEVLGDDSGAAEKWQLMSPTEGREQTAMLRALFIILRRAVSGAAAEHSETRRIRMLRVVGGDQQHLIKGGFSDDSGFARALLQRVELHLNSLYSPRFWIIALN